MDETCGGTMPDDEKDDRPRNFAISTSAFDPIEAERVRNILRRHREKMKGIEQHFQMSAPTFRAADHKRDFSFVPRKPKPVIPDSIRKFVKEYANIGYALLFLLMVLIWAR